MVMKNESLIIFVVDIYVCAVSYTHFVASKPYFIAIVSTTAETDKPEREIQIGLDLLGPIREKYALLTPSTVIILDKTQILF